MNYVLAGTALLAWSIIRGRVRIGDKTAGPFNNEPTSSPMILADWIPSMLSGAITAGVAPLLFLQILYQREFYTANLLLFHRWMSILPILIVGFYSLYLLRSKWLSRRSTGIKAGIGVLPFLCVAFIAYSWTENHLLSLNKPEQWRAFYAQNRQIYFEAQLIPRLAVWGIGSISTMCTWLGWQLRHRMVCTLPVEDGAVQQLSRIALCGLFASCLCGCAYYWISPSTVAVFFGPFARWYLVIALIGMICQGVGWIQVFRRATSPSSFPTSALVLSTAGLLLTLVGMSVCREAVRLTALGESRMAELYVQHAEAIKVDGLGVFMFFTAINAGLIMWCFLLVKRNALQPNTTNDREG